MDRKNFIKTGASLIGASFFLANKLLASSESSDANKITFCAFADLHFRNGDYNWATKRLDAILARALKRNADFVIQLGDFCHNVETAAPVLDKYNAFKIPTYHTMGNHDFEATKTLECVCAAYRLKRNFYSFDIKGFKFIVLDTNYFKNKSGVIEHYASSSAYDKCHQKEAIVTQAQLELLEAELSTAKKPCVIFSHHGFRCVGGITNADEFKKVLYSNQRTPVMWINGHFHRNSLNLENNVAFFSLNSPTSDWLNVTHNAYPLEIMNSSPLAKHELLFDKPVNAIITITDDGEFIIDGMKGGMYLGITPEQVGDRKYDAQGLACDASVLSAHFKLYNPNQS